jgi:protein-tyrosine phosphatase
MSAELESGPPLGGVVNFRDFGGQQAAGGRRVVPGRLFRSGHHGDATDDDLAALANLGLGLVVDLRRPAERQRIPSRRPEPFEAVLIEHQGPLEAALPPHLAFLAAPDATPALIVEQMTAGYRGYPFDPAYVEVYRSFFPALAAAQGPILIHCHAGKDRTGFLAALTLHTLVVAQDDILADYLATNRHNRAEDRIPELSAAFLRDHGKPASAPLLRQVMRAEAAYLEASFEAIRARHGSTDVYLENVLGVTPALRGRLAAKYLEPAV